MAARKGLAPTIRRLHTSYPELSNQAIARKVGCQPANVSVVLKQFTLKTAEEVAQFAENKAEIYDAIQQRCLESITDKKLSKTSVSALVTSAAILEDKARLVRGQATGINVNVLLDVAEAIRQRRDGDDRANATVDALPTKDLA